MLRTAEREQSISEGFHEPQWMKQGPAKPRALDLFSGTKSVARVLETMGFEVVSVNEDPAWYPDICVDVLQWELWNLPRGQFQIIFASLPCTEYSQALTTGLRDLQAADVLVWRTLNIIRHFCPQQCTLRILAEGNSHQDEE